MINVIAAIRLKPNSRAQFCAIFKANALKVVQEAGCIEYVLTADCPAGLVLQQLDENVVTIIEKWQSVAALHDHLASAHMLAYKDAVADIVDSVVLKILEEI
jgi:quinol monooxygenase YgiN